MTQSGYLGCLKKFFHFSHEEKLMICEGVFLLFAAKLLIGSIPFPKIAKGLGRYMQETSHSPHPQNLQTIRQVRQTLLRLSNNTLWENTCLVQALAAKTMLNRRGISCTLYFGMAKAPKMKKGWVAHAWLRSGNILVTGADGGDLSTFSVLSVFGDRE